MSFAMRLFALVAALSASAPALAEDAFDAQNLAKPGGGGDVFSWMLEALIFGGLGIVILIGAYYLWELITPYSVKEQLIKEKNMAVAVVVAAFILGTALVISAAIAPA